MNQAKNRLQALGLVDRALKATPDGELEAAVAAMKPDHVEALEKLADDTTPQAIRDAAAAGRINGTMESIAVVVSDACLADCIEQLGPDADHPSSDRLREVLPGVIERHGKGITQVMLAATVAGEAEAAAIIRDLLKNDELVKLPPAEAKPLFNHLPQSPKIDDAEREAIKAKRLESRRRQRDAAAARREQSLRDRGRA